MAEDRIKYPRCIHITKESYVWPEKRPYDPPKLPNANGHRRLGRNYRKTTPGFAQNFPHECVWLHPYCEHCDQGEYGDVPSQQLIAENKGRVQWDKQEDDAVCVDCGNKGIPYRKFPLTREEMT